MNHLIRLLTLSLLMGWQSAAAQIVPAPDCPEGEGPF